MQYAIYKLKIPHGRSFYSLIFNPQVFARPFRFFVDVKCKYKIKLFAKNRSYLYHIRVGNSK